MTNRIKRLSIRPLSQHLYLLFVLISGITMSKAEAQNIMQIHNASVGSGQQVTISISIANTSAFVGFQLDIPLLVAFSYVANSATLNPARSNGHMFSASLINNNSTLRIISFSINNTPFVGNSGEVASFKLLAGTVPGSYPLTINNALIADAGSNNIMTNGINGTVTLQAPNIQISPPSQDFGNNPLGTFADRVVNIQNTGNLPLVVTGISFDSPYFENMGSGNFTLTAGQSTTRTIRFHANEKGTYNKIMSIHSNDPDQGVSTVNLQAIAFAVNELHCGNMQAASGTLQTLSVSINNMEAFVGFQFDILLPTPLSYVPGSALLNPARSNDHQVTVNMVNTSTLRVIGFSASNQAFLGNNGVVVSLVFGVNGTGGWYPLILGSVIIGDVSGYNITSASYGGALTITAPDIHTNSSINFGNVAVNASASQNLTIYNYGQEDLHIGNITFTNPVYSIFNSLPITIEPWNSQQISISFQPQSTGQTTGQMRIFSNDPDENPFLVQLNTNVFRPNYITVSNLTASPGTTVTLPISVENYDPFVGFQFDLILPEGVSYVNSSAVLNPGRKQDHNISVSTMQNGAIRILAFSMQQLPFLGNEGTIVTLVLTLEPTLSIGNYEVGLLNGILGDNQSNNILWGVNNGLLKLPAFITSAMGEGGTLLPSGNVMVYYGQNQTFTITPNTGYEIANVLVDGVSVGAVGSYTFSNVTANHTIEASFSILTYTINASAGANGTIAPSGNVNVNYGQNQIFTITPNTGYEIANVLVDGVSVGAVGSYTFSNVTANHTIEASFSILTYTINASAGSGGIISPQGTVTVSHGDSQEFIFYPDENYIVSSVWVNGDSLGFMESYTFVSIIANHSIHVDFQLAIGLNSLSDDNVFVNIFPNPTIDQLTIRIQNDSGRNQHLSFKLIDLFGNVLLEDKLENNLQTINVSWLASGLYHFLFFNGDINSKAIKLVIN